MSSILAEGPGRQFSYSVSLNESSLDNLCEHFKLYCRWGDTYDGPCCARSSTQNQTRMVVGAGGVSSRNDAATLSTARVGGHTFALDLAPWVRSNDACSASCRCTVLGLVVRRFRAWLWWSTLQGPREGAARRVFLRVRPSSENNGAGAGCSEIKYHFSLIPSS